MNWLLIFLVKEKELSLEDRLVLARLIVRYGDCRDIYGGVRDLARRLKLPVQMVSTSLPRLARLGALQATVEEGHIGRPSYKYAMTHMIAVAARNAPKPQSVHHFRVIESLVLDIPSSTIKKKTDTLSPLNALVLAFLLFHGRSSGVICRLPKERYRDFLGINGNRLDSQVKKLKRLGYILGVRPGAYSKRFLGVVPSTIFLNLARCYGSTSVQFDREVHTCIFCRNESVAEIVFNSAMRQQAARWKEVEVDGPGYGLWQPGKLKSGASRFFFDVDRSGVQAALQVLLDVCACEQLLAKTSGTDEHERNNFIKKYGTWFFPGLAHRNGGLSLAENQLLSLIFNWVRVVMREIRWLMRLDKVVEAKGDLVGLAIARKSSFASTDLFLVVQTKKVHENK